ncbi:P-type DNA transfer ATPase VirB11 [Mesorhizobium sp. CA13]|uniref:P-type DNA transfer ATPase VirB11 n=1 Tax=unclassified Mesorhizobium TaxID=325217 RepID=UPI00112E56E3|nr:MULTISPECIES: P-type DNA transfer ATPase VirB11 [unclassified Mesorhizobium]MBZ9858027.1 P-type DNA transfer ATPase VirB11 [Mesorhizobium sp. CA13]MBZ9967938.1 P-type DNA transfer ATPase VirB11 [Mesorhizobium sp. BR1-1-2]MCA0016614.1 P-type DNA transfer ATPase VirB11 [Mesorhizobium sp. B294B1A1]MCA0040952.1 P-type DNA transfer ATPase VirB11 [Mesorhizobium sp. B292B1B]TPM36804.1 P-type DNA transfer ATPase VirB11 [Mesorhizobium sp. B2-3-2]
MSVASTEPANNDQHYFLYRSLEPLKHLLADPRVVEISINKPGHVYVERLGARHMEFHDIPSLTTGDIVNMGERVAAATNQFISSANPILSAALPSGERIQFVLPPAAPDGGAVSIRKQVVGDFTLEDYRDEGAFGQVSVAIAGRSSADRVMIELLCRDDIHGFIRAAIASRVSILISGGTSSGKTTFLNACLKAVDRRERLITLEDTRELSPPQPNTVHLLSSKGDQGTAAVTIQNLLEASLRMRPDRLFVGEVRGAEAFSFLRAINTGHPGSMSTVHADTPRGAYEQLAMMVMQSGLSAAYPKADLISYIRSVIPIVIQLRRDGGRRGVSELYFSRMSRS